MAKKRGTGRKGLHSDDYTDDTLKERGMFVGNKPTASIGGGFEFTPTYKTPGGAGGKTLRSPEALIADAEFREEMSRSGRRDARLLRIREESSARKIAKRF